MRMILIVSLAVMLVFAGQTISAQDRGAEKSNLSSETDAPTSMGVHRVTDEAGRTWIIYSTQGSSEEKSKIREQYEEDRRRSWEMLNNIIIDTRRSDQNRRIDPQQTP